MKKLLRSMTSALLALMLITMMLPVKSTEVKAYGEPTVEISYVSNYLDTKQMVNINIRTSLGGLNGYYWGTNSNYRENYHYSTSSDYISTSASATQTVSSEGTYYLTATDTAGHVSETLSIHFSKITLDANGGNLGLKSDYVIVKAGNPVSVTPTRPGWTFKGWSNNKDATSGVTSLYTYSSLTYYAIWEKTEA